MTRGNALFSTNDFSSQLRGTWESAVKEINSIDGDELLNTSPSALVDHMVEKYKVEVPVLDETGITVDQREGPVAVDRFQYDVSEVPGTWFDYYVPFQGEAAIFKSRASTFNYNPPLGEVRGTELRLSYGIAPAENKSVVAQRFARDLAAVNQHLAWLRVDATSHNSSLEGLLRQAVDRRRQKLLDDRKQVAALGYPMRQRGTSPTYVVPTVRKKPEIQRPSGGSAPFVPEPVLDMEEYERILTVIANLARAIELSPSAFSGLDEEALRSHILVQLNGHYEGKVTGETFNVAGKTDVIIKEGERNLFIAECKLWSGPKGLSEALDQVLSYTSWRDTKTAILLFNRGKQLSTVLAKIPETVLSHPQCRKQIDYRSETGFRFAFAHPDDSGRELLLTVLVFEVPR